MSAQALFPFPVCSPVTLTQLAAISDEQAFFDQAHDFFGSWRDLLEQGHQTFGESLNREWLVTSLRYCQCGDEAISQKLPEVVMIFARQLNFCIVLGQQRGVVSTQMPQTI
jgi:hypothetical protein